MATWKRLQVTTRCTDSHKALSITESKAEAPGKQEVTVKVGYAGINATDLNSFMGGYGAAAEGAFDAGLEALGTVTAVGEGVTRAKVNDVILVSGLGSWADYKNFREASIVCVVPTLDPKYLTIPISLLTAAISVGEQSEAKEGDVAVVTAAAGGFGQFTVQFLKKRGCTVIGTCSNKDKGEFLKSIGCDRVVNYKEEVLGEVLKKEYPKGVDIVYETIGGEIFDQCLQNLAVFGRMIIIGSITGYKAQTGFRDGATPTPKALLTKSASMKGFFLFHFAHLIPKYIEATMPDLTSGKLVAQVDAVKTFEGLDQVADAVEHLHSGKSFGKVVVKIQ